MRASIEPVYVCLCVSPSCVSFQVTAWAFMGEPLGLHGLAGVVLSVLGLVVLTRPPFLFGGHAWVGREGRVGGQGGQAEAACGQEERGVTLRPTPNPPHVHWPPD